MKSIFAFLVTLMLCGSVHAQYPAIYPVQANFRFSQPAQFVPNWTFYSPYHYGGGYARFNYAPPLYYYNPPVQNFNYFVQPCWHTPQYFAPTYTPGFTWTP